MHALPTFIIALAVIGISIPLFLLIAAVGGWVLFAIAVKIVEFRYPELFDYPDAAYFAREKTQIRRRAIPIEVKLESMDRRG